MNKVSSKLILLLLATASQKLYPMEGQSKQLSFVPTQSDMALEDNCSSESDHEQVDIDTEKVDPNELYKVIKKCSVELADPKSDLLAIVTSETRKKRQENYKFLKKVVPVKEKRLELLAGFEDLSDDEALYVEIEKVPSENAWESWKKVYEHSKHKTDDTIPTIVAKAKNAPEERKKAITDIKMHTKKIKELEQKLEAAKVAKQESIQRRKNLSRIVKNEAQAIQNQNNIKQQNENFVKESQKALQDKIKSLEDIIISCNSDLESLLIGGDDYINTKKNLEQQRTDALEAKKKCEAQLEDIQFYLPKINEPGSTSRQVKSTVSNVVSSLNPLTYWK